MLIASGEGIADCETLATFILPSAICIFFLYSKILFNQPASYTHIALGKIKENNARFC